MVVVSNQMHNSSPLHMRQGTRGQGAAWNVGGHGPVSASPHDFGQVTVPLQGTVFSHL